MTELDAVVVREGKNLKGRLLALVLGTVGKPKLGNAPANTVKAIEARDNTATTATRPESTTAAASLRTDANAPPHRGALRILRLSSRRAAARRLEPFMVVGLALQAVGLA